MPFACASGFNSTYLEAGQAVRRDPRVRCDPEQVARRQKRRHIAAMVRQFQTLTVEHCLATIVAEDHPDSLIAQAGRLMKTAGVSPALAGQHFRFPWAAKANDVHKSFRFGRRATFSMR